MASQPWKRQPKERRIAYEAFRYYLMLPGRRSVRAARAAAKEEGVHPCRNNPSNTWDVWRLKYGWVKRAREFDSYQLAGDIERQDRLRYAAYRRHQKAARRVFEQARRAVERVPEGEVPPPRVVAALEAACRLELQALGHSAKSKVDVKMAKVEPLKIEFRTTDGDDKPA